MQKRGVVTAYLLFYLAVAGVATLAGGTLLASSGLIGEEVGADIYSFLSGSPLPEEIRNTIDLSYISALHDDFVPNGTSYLVRNLYPVESESVDLDYGILMIHWDTLRNAVNFINLSDVVASGQNNRSFFVTIEGNTTPIDPFNNTQCLVFSDDEGYLCTFFFRVDEQLSPSGNTYEVDISSSSTNHHRTFTTTYLTPINSAVTTTDTIVTYYYEQGQIVTALALDILILLYYLIQIGIALGGVLLLVLVGKKVYMWLRTGGKQE